MREVFLNSGKESSMGFTDIGSITKITHNRINYVFLEAKISMSTKTVRRAN